MEARDKMNIYQKLLKARDIIKNSPVKKEGKNTYSNYEYFTPSQIIQLVHNACNEVGLLHLYRLEKIEGNIIARLTVIDTDKPESGINYEIPTAIPDIKATNEAQKIGGTITYSNRYLLMLAFDIADNNLDFDTTENTEKQEKKQDKTVKKTGQNIPIIPEITDKFKFEKWDKAFNEDGTINYNGRLYLLSDVAREKLESWIEHQLEIEFEKQRIAQEQQHDLDFINNMGK